MLLSERFAAARPRPAAAVRPSPRGPRPLPVDATSLVGREDAIEEVAGLAGHPDVRLVTLTGPGGIGKTRLAVAVGERLASASRRGTAFVPLAAVTQPELVLAGIGRAVGAELAGADSPLEALVEQLGDDRWLLILDNLEQVVERRPRPRRAAGPLSRRGDPGHEPDGAGAAGRAGVPGAAAAAARRPRPAPVEELAASPAVALFVDRARAVRPGFALTEGNAAAVAEICRRLEACRWRSSWRPPAPGCSTPARCLRRLARSLDALGTGAVDLPERQRTLRATVEWSVGLLEDAERSLLEIAAVFADGWTIEAAAQVADLDEDRALDLTEALARHSLVHLDPAGDGPRPRMLETVRAFVAERLAARPDVAEIERRHAGYYRALAEQADRPLRGAGQPSGASACRPRQATWPPPCAGTWPTTPGRCPTCSGSCGFSGSCGTTWARPAPGSAQLLPAAGSFDLQAQAELAVDGVGDRASRWATTGGAGGPRAPGAAARRDPGPLPPRCVPAGHGVDLADRRRLRRRSTEASVCLEQLRGQDEPFWTALAAFTAGLVEMTVGRHDDALRHLTEMRDVAERFGNTWLAAVSRVQLGILAVAQGRPEEARACWMKGWS